jgi:hypothetical protein
MIHPPGLVFLTLCLLVAGTWFTRGGGRRP